MGRTKFFVTGVALPLQILAAGISMAQETGAKVDFRNVAAPVKSVLEELSKAADTSLSAAPDVASDIIVLNLKGTPLNEALTKIADTLHAEWRKEGAGYVLYRGTNREKADEQAELVAKIQLIRNQIADLSNQQTKAGEFDAKAAQKMVDEQSKMFSEATNGGVVSLKGNFDDLTKSSPSARAIVSLLRNMSDAQIASLITRTRVVFATNPTRMQSPLPGGASQIANRFLNEQTTLSNATKPQAGGNNRRVVINGLGGDPRGDGDPKLGIGHIMLIAQSRFGRSNVNLDLVVSDPNGKVLVSGSYFLSTSLLKKPGSNSTPPIANEKPIELSPLSKELADIAVDAPAGGSMGAVKIVRGISISSSDSSGSFEVISAGGNSKTPKMSDELRERVLNPNKYDPLSFAPSEALLATSDQSSKNLVAYLSDDDFKTMTAAVKGGKVVPSKFIEALLRADSSVVSIKDDWIQISPREPAAARRERTNREALGTALRLLDKDQYLSLEQLSKYAIAQKSQPQMDDLGVKYFHLIDTPFAESFLDDLSFGSGWQMLQLYATFSRTQRDEIAQSGRLPFAKFDARQMAVLNDIVYNSPDGPQRDSQARDVVFRFGGGDSPLDERTIMLPYGVPRDGYLESTNKVADGVQAKHSDSAGSKFMTADSLAFIRISREDANLAGLGLAGESQPDQFRIAKEHRLSFKFMFAPQIAMNRQLTDPIPSNAPFANYDKLPYDFRKQVDEKLEAMRKGFAPGNGGAVPPMP
ncbi:MAG: hypothetical protein J0H02_11875 [Armatimonadetes bacterium]|nr:hypothetical protein [Armatimonadota bacterium]